MGTNLAHVLTLANSIIGVSVLAMPFCFKQCGIALSILMLYFSSFITKLACHYLIKSAIMERMKNFEMLAFRAFGRKGKMTVELCIIGFMLGTCVAFFVIMGDLGPNIIGPVLGIEHPSALRPSVLIGVAVFVVLPLGLLRNVDSLSAICAASICFYMCLVLKVVVEAGSNLLAGNWFEKVIWWRPSGILQCIPIFSMALSCQTQLFEIFDSLPNVPLERTNAVVRLAINMTTLFYIAVGFFGYTAYCNQTFTGNLMLNFSPTIASEVMKIGFILSIAVSFPLVIFPCRNSIYSFLYSKIQHGYEGLGSSHIPETKFQCITLVIVTLSLVIGLIIPNIEIVLGLVGSTIGVFICVIIPGMIFNNLSSKNNNEKLVAQVLVGVGFVIMILGIYANLFATEEVMSSADPKLKLKAIDKIQLQVQPNLKLEKEIEKAMKKLNVEENPNTILKKSSEAGPLKKEVLLKVDSLPKVDVENGPAPEPIQPEPPKEILKKPNNPELKEPERPKETLKATDTKIEKKDTVLENQLKEEVIKEPKNRVKKVLNMKPDSENKDQKEIIPDKVNLVGELEKKSPEVPSIENVKAESSNLVNDVKENLTLSMAQGVPLPLVIKGVETINKDPAPPQSRDILKSDREKRDADGQIAAAINKTQEENCPKTAGPAVPDDLIKSPRHLTDEQVILDKKLKAVEPELEIGPIQQKRDLKSLTSQNKIVKQET